MTDDDFKSLATRYLEDAIDEDDLRQLNHELLDSPERVRQFNDLRLLVGMIMEHGRSEPNAKGLGLSPAGNETRQIAPVVVGCRPDRDRFAGWVPSRQAMDRRT